uniref:Uncharacterized protein n=1 Tax=Pipistrellus kuhlii TaxID=59472 RepID=A0A7J7RN00_PIPKU|nr:hypothetical protein mPipKuh1_010385 [Pipistrellus kuhlii]
MYRPEIYDGDTQARGNTAASVRRGGTRRSQKARPWAECPVSPHIRKHDGCGLRGACFPHKLTTRARRSVAEDQRWSNTNCAERSGWEKAESVGRGRSDLSACVCFALCQPHWLVQGKGSNQGRTERVCTTGRRPFVPTVGRLTRF